MSRIHLLMAASVIFILSACKKEEASSPLEKKLHSVSQKLNDSIGYSVFHYDADNKLTEVIDSNNNGHSWKTIIRYAGDSPRTITRLYHSYFTIPEFEVLDSLVYENGKVIQKLFKAANRSYEKTNTYSYDAKGRLTADTIYSNNEIYGYRSFVYDANDNVVQWQEYEKQSGIIRSRGNITVTYSSNKSPFKNLGLIAYIIRDNFLYLSKNAPLQANYYDGLQLDYSYQYGTYGLINKAIIRDNEGGTYSYTNVDFTYQ
jgi:hypothetical protein